MNTRKNANKRRSSAGYTMIELLIGIKILFLFSLFVIPAVIYDGEREVNGTVVDCIGVFGDEPQLPDGYHWEVEWNPVVPTIAWFPVGPIMVTLTDLKCPVPDQAIPGVRNDAGHDIEPPTDGSTSDGAGDAG